MHRAGLNDLKGVHKPSPALHGKTNISLVHIQAYNPYKQTPHSQDIRLAGSGES